MEKRSQDSGSSIYGFSVAKTVVSDVPNGHICQGSQGNAEALPEGYGQEIARRNSVAVWRSGERRRAADCAAPYLRMPNAFFARWNVREIRTSINTTAF